ELRELPPALPGRPRAQRAHASSAGLARGAPAGEHGGGPLRRGAGGLRASRAGDRCVAVLAFSEYARRQFPKQAASSPHRAAIEAKLRVRYPVMPLRRNAPEGGTG